MTGGMERMKTVRRHPLLSFFVLAYGFSWAYWIPLALAGVRTAPGSTATHVPGLLGPALAALIITGVTEGRAGVVSFAKRLVCVSRPTWRFFAYSLSPLLFLAPVDTARRACGALKPPLIAVSSSTGLRTAVPSDTLTAPGSHASPRWRLGHFSQDRGKFPGSDRAGDQGAASTIDGVTLTQPA